MDGEKILVKGKPKAELHILCYVFRTGRSKVRAQRGRSEESQGGA